MAYSETTPAGRAVKGIIADLPGLIAVAIVDTDSGMNMASHTNSEHFNPDMAAAYNTQVVQHNMKSINNLRMSNGVLEDILITATDQYHLIKLINDGSMFMYLAVNSLDTNLAIAREVMRIHSIGLN